MHIDKIIEDQYIEYEEKARAKDEADAKFKKERQLEFGLEVGMNSQDQQDSEEEYEE